MLWVSRTADQQEHADLAWHLIRVFLPIRGSRHCP